ncbi:MAG: DUF3899 domain-containing protein [Acetatifactor sp.]|nr:DUF3899 domain-containing protein [Acetatifactor sp.]
MKKVSMKYTKYIVQSVIGLFLSFGIMCHRGLFQTETAADRVMLVCDGFSAVALLYMAVGGLLWTASTGFFDIFGYGIRKGAHALLPGLVHDAGTDYYEYRMEKREGRKSGGEKSMIIVGWGYFILGTALTAVWYCL